MFCEDKLYMDLVTGIEKSSREVRTERNRSGKIITKISIVKLSTSMESSSQDGATQEDLPQGGETS